MKRQSIIYSVFALLGLGLFAYMLPLCATAWSRFGSSATFFTIASLATLFALLSAVFAALAILFRWRGISSITPAGTGVTLIPERHSFHAPVAASNVRVLKVIGEQFANDESAPKFTVFIAAGKVWVTPAKMPSGANIEA